MTKPKKLKGSVIIKGISYHYRISILAPPPLDGEIERAILKKLAKYRSANEDEKLGK